MDIQKWLLSKETGVRARRILFASGPILFVTISIGLDLDPEHPAVTYTLATAIWMALWWVTEVVPLGITALLPIVLFPVMGVMDGKDVSITYFNHVIFLFIGGFLVALAIQKWKLHNRIALRILMFVGNSPGRILLGFMFAAAFLSMWISNTAAAMLMVPILISIISQLEDLNGTKEMRSFSIGLLLSIAYACSIGGISTLVGTPPNLSFARILYIYFPEAPEITFANWFFFAFPICLFLFIFVWAYIYRLFIYKKGNWKTISKHEMSRQYKALGPVSYEEKVVGVVFVVLALLWFFRSDIVLGFLHVPGWSRIFNDPQLLNDGTVAIAMAVLLFVIPSKQEPGSFLMDWKAAEDIPWEIILLFGGGFALASGFKVSGLSTWFGDQLIWLADVHPLIIIIVVCFLVTFLTELTSNTATVETLLPILAGLAVSIEVNPLLFMLPATVAGSLAFMLPVATPPNAIVFGTKRLRIAQMARAGFVLNLVGIIVVALVSYFFGTAIFGIESGVFPDWALPE